VGIERGDINFSSIFVFDVVLGDEFVRFLIVGFLFLDTIIYKLDNGGI
jgi:hypothetical protein